MQLPGEGGGVTVERGNLPNSERCGGSYKLRNCEWREGGRLNVFVMTPAQCRPTSEVVDAHCGGMAAWLIGKRESLERRGDGFETRFETRRGRFFHFSLAVSRI